MHSIFARKVLAISAIVILLWFAIGFFIYSSPSFKTFFDEPVGVHTQSRYSNDEIEACRTKGQKLSNVFWRKVNLFAKDIPHDMSSEVPKILVNSNFTVYHNSKVHYLHASPKLKKNLSVLLLHGQAFSSDTWNKLQTIQHIAAYGYQVVAVDLPGYGFSRPNAQGLNKTDLLRFLIDELRLEPLVVVSPSMSGVYSVPFLATQWPRLAGFVPVSPAAARFLATNGCTGANSSRAKADEGCRKVYPYLKTRPPKLDCIKVPTLVVFGEKDKGKNSALLCYLPNSQGVEVPNGAHAAYMSDPPFWHRLLYNFLDVLSETLPCTK